MPIINFYVIIHIIFKKYKGILKFSLAYGCVIKIEIEDVIQFHIHSTLISHDSNYYSAG